MNNQICPFCGCELEQGTFHSRGGNYFLPNGEKTPSFYTEKAMEKRKANTVLVCPIDIPRNAALAIMKLNSSRAGVFTVKSNYASSLCQTLGGGVRGPEGEYASGYWYHYHSNNYPSAHCWFIK